MYFISSTQPVDLALNKPKEGLRIVIVSGLGNWEYWSKVKQNWLFKTTFIFHDLPSGQ